MDSKRTTHILLTIIAMGIFFMIFIYMKENYFNTQRVQPVVWEETVPVQSISRPNPVNPTPSPTFTPTQHPTPAPQIQNIILSDGQSYFIEFTGATENHYPMKYCGPTQTSGPGYPLDTYDIFVPINATSCDNNQVGATGLFTDKLTVQLKSGVVKSKLDTLNSQYDVSITNTDPNRAGHYTLKVNNSGLNAYTVAKKYFDTGYFDWTSIYQAYSINPGDGVN